MKAKKRPAPPRKCQMSCLKRKGEMTEYIFFAVSIPVVVAEQLAVLVEVPRLRRGDVGVLLLLHKEVEGWESADQAADCGRNTFIKIV